MADAFNPAAVEKIHDLCDELAAKHGLDAGTRDELCGHLEDKLLGYLGGNVRVSEDDALILVRAHFGDADRIASQLGHETPSAGRTKREQWVRRAILATALVSLLVFPALVLVVQCANLGATRGILATMLGFVLLAIIEVGLYLASRADIRRLWQRLIAACALIPPILLIWRFLTFGINTVTFFTIEQPLFNIYVAIAATAFVSLVCHVWLFALLLFPTGRARSGPVVRAGIAR
jgi:hypothetical protein